MITVDALTKRYGGFTAVDDFTVTFGIRTLLRSEVR